MESFQHLRWRLSFPVMQEYCKRYGLPKSLGWEKLEEKLQEMSSTGKAKRLEISDTLATIFQETIAIGHRAVQIFHLEIDEIQGISKYLDKLQVEKSAYLNNYPYPLSAAALENVPDGASLCDIRIEPDSISLIFCTKRLIEYREPRTRNEIGSEAINQFGWQEYDEFVLIKRQYLQCYELVRIDTKQNLIEFRVEVHTGVDTDVSISELKDKVNDLLFAQFGNSLQLIKPTNLFPVINSIYNTSDEGIVVELGFTTETGSSKHEKMRQSGGDLRQEQFHVGGKAAIRGALTPFRIAVRWTIDGSRVPEEVMLPGSIRQIGRIDPYLDYMVLKGALTESGMRDCIKRVVKYLP